MFGPHLIIDGSRCDTRKLGDRILVEQILNDYPNAIGMTKIGGPYMFEYQAPDPAYSGVSGLVVIAESHIAIHTFPELDYFTMDIFSCKNFDHQKAIDYIRDAFDVKEMDRMLVQRGLSFRGPHHGEHGATDELIEAAEARLAAGIISKDTAVPGMDYANGTLAAKRDAALAHRIEHPATPAATAPAAGKMLWPQYGVTPDYGTYGDVVADASSARAGATIVPLSTADATLEREHHRMQAVEPVQVNPTASISGLLDKLSVTGSQGRTLGRGVATWELLARDPDTTIALALSTPVIAEGQRELLVYALEHRYADVVVASAEDLFADLYEALGFVHFADDEETVATDAGRDATRAAIADFLASVDAQAVKTGVDFWRLLGEWLPTHAPRKGLLQAAAASGVAVVAPDLGTSAFGTALLAARARGAALALDPSNDVVALARLIAGNPRLGIVRVGEGAADALPQQARDIAPALGLTAPTLTGSVSLGTSRKLAQGDHHVALRADASLALPLIVTALAQRVPGVRRMVAPAALEAVEAALA